MNVASAGVGGGWRMHLVELSRCAVIRCSGVEMVEATCQDRSCYEKKDDAVISAPWYQDFTRFVQLKGLSERSHLTYYGWDLQRYLRGAVNYYALGIPYREIVELDGWLRRRVRHYHWKPA